MKKNILFIGTLISGTIFGQVGIGIINPNATLDVNGDTLVQSYLIDTVNENVSGDYFLLTRSKDTTPVGKVKMLDVSLRDVAPVNAYNVIIQNAKLDEVVNLNTNLETSKYVVAIVGATFTTAVSSTVNSSGTYYYGSYSTEVTRKTVGTTEYYAVNLDFKGTGTTSSKNGTWNITLVVYEKALVKEWGNYTGTLVPGGPNISDGFIGTSTVTPIGLQ